MKLKLMMVGTMVVVPLLLLACSTAPKQVSVKVPCNDFMEQQHISKQVAIPAGGSLIVTLCSNPTTGFQWSESAQSSDQTVLQQTDHKFVPPEETGTVGGAGEEVWTFEALKKGTSTVSLEYSRPWEGGEQGEWTFTLTVTVK